MKNLYLFVIIFVIFASNVNSQSIKNLNKFQYVGDEVATKFWKFAFTAYCNESYIQDWNCGTVCKEYSNFTDVLVFYDIQSNAQFYAGYNPIDDAVYLVFRGSLLNDWMLNVFEDIDFLKKKIAFNKCDNNCSVHSGFYNTYISIANETYSVVETLMKMHPGAQLVILGHSLGAAMAVFSAIDFYQMGYNLTFFYTFGCPRVGDVYFADWFGRTIGSTLFAARITHYKDMIPHLPPQDFGFVHYNYEVFYENNVNLDYKICYETEDPLCADQFSIWETSMTYHADYMLINNNLIVNVQCDAPHLSYKDI